MYGRLKINQDGRVLSEALESVALVLPLPLSFEQWNAYWRKLTKFDSSLFENSGDLTIVSQLD